MIHHESLFFFLTLVADAKSWPGSWLSQKRSKGRQMWKPFCSIWPWPQSVTKPYANLSRVQIIFSETNVELFLVCDHRPVKYLVTSDGCDWFARHFINIVLISPTHLLHVENAFYHGAVPPHRIKGTYAMHITSMNCVLNLILRTIFEGTYVHIYCDVIFRIQHTAFSQETLF